MLLREVSYLWRTWIPPSSLKSSKDNSCHSAVWDITHCHGNAIKGYFHLFPCLELHNPTWQLLVTNKPQLYGYHNEQISSSFIFSFPCPLRSLFHLGGVSAAQNPYISLVCPPQGKNTLLLVQHPFIPFYLPSFRAFGNHFLDFTAVPARPAFAFTSSPASATLCPWLFGLPNKYFYYSSNTAVQFRILLMVHLHSARISNVMPYLLDFWDM